MKGTYWIILIILVVVVGGYLLMKGGGPSTAYNSNTVSGNVSATPTDTPVPSPEATPTPIVLEKNSAVSEMSDPTKGTYLTNTKGVTLYTFDNDQSGVSNCTGTCAQLWPPYTTKTVPTTLPSNISTLQRADGTTQYSWNGMPLYYYSKDVKAGDISGDGIGGVWHLVIL
jgi:predicted lipoprotein with Yx(FWY)xxD motif